MLRQAPPRYARAVALAALVLVALASAIWAPALVSQAGGRNVGKDVLGHEVRLDAWSVASLGVATPAARRPLQRTATVARAGAIGPALGAACFALAASVAVAALRRRSGVSLRRRGPPVASIA